MILTKAWSPVLLGFVLLAWSGLQTRVMAETQSSVAILEGQTAPASDSVHLSPLMGDLQSEAQVTSVSQLSDVQPTDWAFQALQSLVERYGCIAGYPDGTFNGNRAATRYELAAALNACLDQISDRFATKEDLAAVKALQEEFKAELATLKGRVDGLEARTKTLEAQQFSTTTKLQGEVIFAVSDVFGDQARTGLAAGTGPNIDSRVTFTERVRLNFLTSFTGKDRLYVRLQTSNREVNFAGATGTNGSRLAFDTGNTNNNIVLDRLDYMFPVGKKLKIDVFANGGFHHYYTTTVNPFFEGGGGGKGALSFFGERNPIYRIGTVGYASTSGVGASYQATPKIRFDVGYLAGRSNLSTGTQAANPTAGITAVAGATDSGLFGGSYSALAQLSFKPTKTTEVALTYVRNYAPDGNLRYFSGSNYANNPFVAVGNIAQPLISNSVGAQGSFKITPKFAVGGWVGYTNADRANGAGNADILNGAINFAFSDLFKKGAVGGIIVGVPPTVVGSSFVGAGGRREDPTVPIHIEALYQFPINNNITITPGIIYLINPNGNSANSDVIVGVVRTTFTF
jgi:hypothetical protein